jgi:FHS family L-fucose permease-like MFS transporter
MQKSVLGIAPEQAGKLVSLYWGGAMVGRFIGSYALRRVVPGFALVFCALCACRLVLASAFSSGNDAAFALIAVGMFNSIMFPTIFSLASERLGADTPNGSGLLCMAIVGGAIVPLIAGAIADRAGIAAALLLPAGCYVWIAVYGLMAGAGFGLSRQSAPAGKPTAVHAA